MGARSVSVALTFVMLAGTAAAQPASTGHPIAVHMRRGAQTITLGGVLRQGRDCCAYVLEARGGQALTWRETGAAVRVTMTYPDGHTDGPGLPPTIPLPDDGTYIFTVSPNLMADGAFGRFRLTLTIPPLAR